MEKSKKEDLRVTKTLLTIRQTFREMICEMDYEDITIKELTERAMINRKTFYLHFESLDDLLEELRDEIINEFTKYDISYKNIEDIKSIIRVFFEYAVSMPELNERLLCSGSYQHIGDRINDRIMEYRAKTNRGAFSKNEYVDNIVFTYFSANSTLIFRQWVKDGKQLPVEELIDVATKLICDGIKPFVQ